MTDEQIWVLLPELEYAETKRKAEQVRNATLGRAVQMFEKETGRKPDLFSPDFTPYIIRAGKEI